MKLNEDLVGQDIINDFSSYAISDEQKWVYWFFADFREIFCKPFFKQIEPDEVIMHLQKVNWRWYVHFL